MPVARYSKGAMLLHWLIAILVIANWQIAEKAHEGPREQAGAVMYWHIAIGMLILLLTVVRIVWRLTHARPPLGDHLAQWEKLLAKAVHAIFYFLLIGLPLLGWIGVSGEGGKVDMFGIVWPSIGGLDRKGGHGLLEVHQTLGNIMVWLIGLHVLGALKHHFWDKDGELWRMLPWGKPRDPAE